MSWILHRVDDRLIHGQVVVAWGMRFRPARIVVADDESAANAWEKELLESAAPDVEVRVLTLAETAAIYAAETAKPGGAFLIVRGLPGARLLVEAGAAIPKFTLGGIHYAPGRAKLNEYVYLDNRDREAARALLARGVRLEVQDVPATRPQPLTELDPQLAST